MDMIPNNVPFLILFYQGVNSLSAFHLTFLKKIQGLNAIFLNNIIGSI